MEVNKDVLGTVILSFVALVFFWIAKSIFFPVDSLSDTDIIIKSIELLIIGGMYLDMLWHKISKFLKAIKTPDSAAAANVKDAHSKGGDSPDHELTWPWFFAFGVASIFVLLAASTWLKFLV